MRPRNRIQRRDGEFDRRSVLCCDLINPFPTLFSVRRTGSGEVPPEACMALPGRSKWLPVATVTYINYPSRRKPSFRRAPGCPGLRFCPPRGFSERPYDVCMMLTEFAMDRPCPHELTG